MATMRRQLAKKQKALNPPAYQTKRLPDELAEFLMRDTYSMMIKGDSGTGKTTLALSILKALQPLENVLYISTRTSPIQLFEHHPWIEDIFTPSERTPEAGEQEVWENVVDSRLDEPNAVFERITNVLMDEQAPTVVIDSWEALGDSLGADPLKTDLRVLESWRERAGARFIFIGEDPANSTLDHLVEGVVVLGWRTQDGRRVRELSLSKLHGVQIRKPTYFFTLDGGEFRSFPEFFADDYVFRQPLPAQLDRPFRREKGKIPTGYDELDRALKGGLPLEGTTVVTLGEGVTPSVGLVFLSKLVQGWASGGGKVLVQPPAGVDEGFLRQYAKSFGGAGRVTVGHIEGRANPTQTLSVTAQPGRAPVEPGSVGKGGPRVVLVQQEHAGHRLAAESRLVLSLLEGTLFVRGEVPWTPLFGAVPGYAAGNPTLYLEPVV